MLKDFEKKTERGEGFGFHIRPCGRLGCGKVLVAGVRMLCEDSVLKSLPPKCPQAPPQLPSSVLPIPGLPQASVPPSPVPCIHSHGPATCHVCAGRRAEPRPRCWPACSPRSGVELLGRWWDRRHVTSPLRAPMSVSVKQRWWPLPRARLPGPAGSMSDADRTAGTHGLPARSPSGIGGGRKARGGPRPDPSRS